MRKAFRKALGFSITSHWKDEAVFTKIRTVLCVVGALLSLLLSGAAIGHAAPATAPDSVPDEVGVLGGCNLSGCGTAANATGLGFHVTLLRGDHSDAQLRWVAPWSTLGLPQLIDIDEIHVGSGCRMAGVITNRLLPPHIGTRPFSWGPGWHTIHTNETASVFKHSC